MEYIQNLLILFVEDKKVDIQNILEHLSALGIIDDLHVKRALIKREFMQRQGKDETGCAIRMDLAVKYDCSVSHVGNCIYNHSEIKIAI